MSSTERDGLARTRSAGKGLQLSRHTKGIQNTTRSVRSLGGGSSHGKRSGLGDGLAKVDSKRGLGGGGKKPTLSDDLSIDDSVLSEAEKAKRKGKRPSNKAPKDDEDTDESPKSVMDSSAPDGMNKSQDLAAKFVENKEKAAAIISSKRKESLRLPPRRASRGRGMNDLSKSEHGKPSSRGRGMNDLSKSEHGKPSSSKMNDLSRSDHGKPFESRRGDELSMSKSEHGSKLPERRNTYSGKDKQHAVQGIYKLLGSMEKPKDSSAKEPAKADASKSRQAARRTKTSDGSEMGQRMAGTSIQGIRNLLDKDPSLRDRSMRDRSLMDRSNMSNDASESESSERDAPAKEDFGTNHSRSLQGIHKLLGSMGKDANASASSKEKEKRDEKSAAVEKMQKARSSRSARRLQGHQIIKEDDVPPAKQMVDTKERQAARSKKSEDTSDDDENDYDTVATPKTATGPPPPPLKEAPPPPQRKMATRRTRSALPNVTQQKPKPSNGSHNSAPAKIPCTPLKSPGGFVIELQNPATPGAGCTTPQNFSTPQAVTMPVVPGDDFDSVGTPQMIVGVVAPPPVTGAPPPPPKRNMDMGSRWKNRRGKGPAMPGQAQPNVCATPSQPKAPAMSFLSPGGIVIEVSSKKSGIRGPNRPPEPMTPMAEMTPVAAKSGNLSGSPHYSGLRNTFASQGRNNPIVPQTPSMHSHSENGGSFLSTPSMHSKFMHSQSASAGGSWLSTPSMQSNSGDISELTPGTFVGNHHRMTPRQQMAPSTPKLYTSPGVISELTPGGYSVGLFGDDDYQSSVDRDDAQFMSTPSMPSRGGVISELTPRSYGILLEEEDEDDEGPQTLPSTPSLNSPAGVVSELTPPGDKNKPKIQVGLPPVPSTPSVNNESKSGIVSELTTPGTYGPGRVIPTTPSVHSPAGIVSVLTPPGSTSDGSMPNAKILSNHSAHSGAVSDITPGSFSTSAGSAGQVQIAG